jgi:hypothetical protein
MLKQLVAILVFTGMLAQTFSRFFIIMDYELNKDYIAKNLCVNRNKPMMHCNGKCHMMKKMQQEEKKDQENPERKMENKFESISFRIEDLLIIPPYIITSVTFPVFRENIHTDFSSSYFHPPQD